MYPLRSGAVYHIPQPKCTVEYVNLSHAITLRALCCANLVALPLRIEGNDTREVHSLCEDRVLDGPASEKGLQGWALYVLQSSHETEVSKFANTRPPADLTSDTPLLNLI